MPRIYACDHCGRSGGITMGVYYPGRDMAKAPLRLCQSYQGNPVTPSCYHLVVELGEPVGARKENVILAADRHAPKVEAVALRMTEDVSTGLVMTETERADAGVTRYGEVVQTEHPLTGESVPSTPPDAELSPAITEAEKGKGILDPYGATQKPLIDPNSPEAQEYLDALAVEEARKIPAPTGGPRTRPEDEQTATFTEHVDPYGEGPITTPARSEPQDPVTNEPYSPALGSETIEAGSPHVSPADPNATKTPAQIAAEAQRRANAEAEAGLDPRKTTPKRPAKKAAKKAPAKATPAKAAAAPEEPKPVTTVAQGEQEEKEPTP